MTTTRTAQAWVRATSIVLMGLFLASSASAGEPSKRVTARRNLRTGLAATAVVTGVGALTLFAVALVTVMKDFSFPIGCDDFTGTPDAASYPNGKTCSTPSHPAAGKEALLGLGLAATSAAFAIATIATPAFTVHVTPSIAPSSHGVSAKLLEITF